MAQSKKNYTLTGEHFYRFFQCPHWIWYDLYGDQTRKGSVPPLIQMINKSGLPHAKEKLVGRKFEEIKPELTQDLDEAFAATLDLMRQGKNIYHGVLLDQHWAGMPDLLEARPGKSNLGDYHYVVYDIKNSNDLRDEYKFQLAFYSIILERIQGVLPENAYIINARGEERSFDVKEFLDTFHIARESIEKILEGEKPAPFLKSGCKQSPWYAMCVEETSGCNDISLVYRLSQNDQRRFYDVGIRTVSDLAKANIDDIRVWFEDWPFDKLMRLYNQAQVLTTGEPKILRKNEFPKVTHEIYFDIESDPTQDIDYLLGILTRKPEGEPIYTYFLAKDKKDEERMWREFLSYVESLEDFVIYHYSFYEKEVFQRLGNRYGISRELDEKFKQNTIDLHQVVINSVVLPLYFYSLKDIARFLGFQWRAENAGGAESVVWYNDYISTQDPKILQKILDYNEDDVRATLYVKEWIEKQKPHTSREKISLEEL